MMLRQLITLVLLASQAYSVDNGNAAEFKALCDLIRLAEAKNKIDISIDTSAADNAIKELDYLNLSAAEDGWKKDKNGLLAKKQPDDKATEREAWERHVSGLGEKDVKTGKYKYTNLTTQRRRGSLAKALSRTLTAAQALKASYDAYASEVQKAPAKAQQALTAALFGAGNTDVSSAGLRRTQADNCKDESGGIAGKALATDLLCICTGDQSNSIKLCDQTKTGGNVGDYTASDAAKDAYTAAVGHCPPAEDQTSPTPEALLQALTVFRSLIGRQAARATGAAGHYIFGQPHTTGACDGSSAQGMCVSYKTSLKGGSHDIAWAQAIDRAAQELATADKAKQAAAAVSGQLTAMVVHAWALFDDVLYEPEPHQTGAVSGKDTPKSAEDKEKECNAPGNDEEACKKLEDKGCVFNTEAKKCELKKELKEKPEKENQETEGKTGSTNSTGSSSFVIHKAPLLLAFLLFFNFLPLFKIFPFSKNFAT
uniref:Variant surface glycoprotein 1125.541 n=1 Tax=Trypanosoma brucei TaxID=5691 RepID=A0A1J0R612_9TRYP|nr:variant surface glycoprotein 1125.541 [Trypanosoma brucei]